MIYLWDLRQNLPNAQAIAPIALNHLRKKSIAFSYDAKYLIFMENYKIYFFAINDLLQTSVVACLSDNIKSVSFSPNGKYLTAIDYQGKLFFWHFCNNSFKKIYFNNELDHISSFNYSKNSIYVLIKSTLKKSYFVDLSQQQPKAEELTIYQELLNGDFYFIPHSQHLIASSYCGVYLCEIKCNPWQPKVLINYQNWHQKPQKIFLSENGNHLIAQSIHHSELVFLNLHQIDENKVPSMRIPIQSTSFVGMICSPNFSQIVLKNKNNHTIIDFSANIEQSYLKLSPWLKDNFWLGRVVI